MRVSLGSVRRSLSVSAVLLAAVALVVAAGVIPPVIVTAFLFPKRILSSPTQ